MGKWSGNGVPPTRKKLHRWREALRQERAADEKMRQAALSSLEATSRRSGVDFMLTERGELL